jgi:DNA-3-methyladenine glycosylase
MLPQSFFIKDALTLSNELIGCMLVHETPEGITAGVIVETESYHQDDEASHSFSGQTARTKVMFGPGGYSYVYFTYGMHYCFNVVAGHEGVGEAVLIRALEPVEGLELMKRRRGKKDILELCSGPAKLVQAMGISKADYGKPLFEGNLYIKPRSTASNLEIRSGPRIGIKKAIDKPWRFWLKDNPFVSRNNKG